MVNEDIFPRHLLARFREKGIEEAIKKESQNFARELEFEGVNG